MLHAPVVRLPIYNPQTLLSEFPLQVELCLGSLAGLRAFGSRCALRAYVVGRSWVFLQLTTTSKIQFPAVSTCLLAFMVIGVIFRLCWGRAVPFSQSECMKRL